MREEIFVFGSNLAGYHTGGSAKRAVEAHGAIWGQGTGRQGESYAIPTLDENFEPLTLEEIENYVDIFIAYAKLYPYLVFNIVAIGCGIAGFTVEQIAPLFSKASRNCNLPIEFSGYLVAPCS